MKKKLLGKSLAFLCCFFLFQLTGKAQSSMSGWTQLKNPNDVSFYYQQSVCSADTLLLLRIINSNANGAIITWSLWGEVPRNTYTVSANQDVAGECPPSGGRSTSVLVVNFPSGKTVNDLVPNIIIP